MTEHEPDLSPAPERLAGTSVGLFGDRVHVVTRDPAGTERRTRELVAAAGFELVSIRAVEPSLEDVFVSVLAEQKPAEDTAKV